MNRSKGRAMGMGIGILLLIACLAASSCATAPAPAAIPSSRPPVAAVQAAPAKAAPAPAPQAGPSSISGEALGLYRSMDAARAGPTDDELKVVASAKTLIGMAPNAKVVVNGKTFTLDCIGTVSAIFYRMDIDITRDFGKYSGNGVNCLFLTLKDKGILHRDKYPRTGDVIVWDNTWDANGDADRTNDFRTHAGVVMAVDDDGTIYYVHENMFRGVIVEYMNLLQPSAASDASGKRFNSSLAIATVTGGPKPPRFLSGEVFNAFGDILRVQGDFKVAEAGGPGGESIAAVDAR